MKTTLSIVLVAAALLAGCYGTKEEAPAVVNATCPMMGDEVTAEGGTYDWNGMTVGFCCDGCSGKFAKLSDEEKKKALSSKGGVDMED